MCLKFGGAKKNPQVCGQKFLVTSSFASASLGGKRLKTGYVRTGLRFCGQTVKKVKIQAAATLIAEAGRARAVSIALGFVIH
ncbi:hypothetical protein MC51_023380 [Serratia marcescens]|nr:hypothetical protein MC51_023380 [Serratia marcescens]MCZ6927852.1 hypothetical protein [Serratia marcescens]OZP48879.1 hypothetical protein CIG46_08510 [Serratia marcescens]OZP53579.1 hypothetical protein CIG37_10270 [Serratia marcescens]OZP57846.1 hypothetical protein CIG56_13045 [Serratia marcescens]